MIFVFARSIKFFPRQSGLNSCSPVPISDWTRQRPNRSDRLRLSLIVLGLGIFALPLTRAQTVYTDIQLAGTNNQIASAAELTVLSGGTFTAASGSVIDLFHATVALPDSLTLKDLKLDGPDNRLLAGSTLTLQSGATFTAAAGSTVDLSAANVNFPTTVVLTSGNQILSGKTLIAPITSILSAPADTHLTLTGDGGGNGGAKIIVENGVNGVIKLIPGQGAPGFYQEGYVDLVSNLPETYFVAPLRWGGGNRYAIRTGSTLFNGVMDHSSGIIYNTQKAPGDVSFGLAFEHAFKDDAGNYSTEFYYAWSGVMPGEVGSNRPFQINSSWGPGYDAALPAGFTQTSFAANKFTILPGGAFGETGFFLNFVPTTPQLFWGGAAEISNTLTLADGNLRGGTGGLQLFSGTGSLKPITFLTTDINGMDRDSLILSGDRSARFYSQTASTDAATGALIVNSNFAVGGAGNVFANGAITSAGGLVSHNSGNPQLSFGGNSTSALIGFLHSSGGRDIQLAGNRNPITGTFVDPSGYHAEISIHTKLSDGSMIRFRTGNAVNTLGEEWMTLNGTGVLTLSGTTAATSTGTGTLRVAGGAGIGGNLHLGGQFVVAGSQFLGGSLNMPGGGIVGGSAGALAFTAGGLDRDIVLTPSGAGRVVFGGPSTFSGNQTLNGTLTLPGGGTLTGSAGSLNLNAGGSNQSITLAPSGTGMLGTPAAFAAGGAISTSATTGSTSTSTGALVVAGGFGLAGDQFLGGSLNLSGGGVLTGASGSLALTAGGTNQNISLTPSGSGVVVLAGPVSTAGTLTVDATANSTSTSTGALVVGGGIAVQKRTSLGDDLVLMPTGSTAATVRLSGTAVTDVPGIWFRDGGAPTASNAALSGSSTATILNGPSGGTVNLRIANTNFLTLGTNAATLQGVPLNVTATTASISQTTGSATFGGGIGVNGRTSTKTLSVGNGAALDLILTVISVLDFPSVGANGGIQDLAVTLTGANLGDSVNIVEASGSFIPAGIVLRAIVTAPNTVTVRASNVTTAAIDPASAAYRITLMSF